VELRGIEPHPERAQTGSELPQLVGTTCQQELETLRAKGVITDAEYTGKREQIISEL
jgi:hypothetical protein